jgi:hypothetical protein
VAKTFRDSGNSNGVNGRVDPQKIEDRLRTIASEEKRSSPKPGRFPSHYCELSREAVIPALSFQKVLPKNN